MAKTRTVYICNCCGAESSQWFGKCPSCDTYGSLEEVILNSNGNFSRGGWQSNARPHQKNVTSPQPRISVKFSDIKEEEQPRMNSGYQELDRVLGGGIVPGSLVLIGGDPGIGKSTLLLQTANQLAIRFPRILYVSAEESGQQVKLRASRLGVGVIEEDEEDLNHNHNGNGHKANQTNQDYSEPNLYVLAETDLEEILRELESLKPQVAIIDSIQTLHFATLNSAPGSVSQVRECTSALMQVAKREGITLFIVGHVTKEGAIAGPRVLEHLVDTVLYFEGDRYASHRLLRSVKNRFGATHEIGIFEMVDHGLDEVSNPSELFLSSRDELAPGTATIVSCEGTRCIVVELQALVSPTSYTSPRRSTTGVDYNRLQQILAVLEKRVGIPLSKLDAYVASAGGLGVEEPAADLGMAIAIVASFRDRTVDPRTVLIGEIGLGGQVRLVSQMELRLKEAAKLGFKRAIVPKGQTYPSDLGLEILCVGKVIDAIVLAIPNQSSSSVDINGDSIVEDQ
ncbi:DNA repair protein RadA [Cyanobacterium aponinum UTEX 3222]|uniref:DNA repair protein RadA n=1 Tax=Cyanobacterium aponinum 0216 TaxID=2676140 RepID=A0A844GYG9_9CHRO|nr:DNA repair protein RadA [Cyanobacterium aponinum]MBD2393445.1 DNA repair protein RadA [Cyanobacterium aponinum FACHB-4101]MTF39026.1 DNA repair protein RadA [Cyanobacterium aponinum 0216]WRL38084.1 DNA repair protein RadA [Cyanobacterium aponinum UTEX 3221]WRL41438.1 DNA repair protein RadA [Cyanobacterium aponinum UTEX 3222]